MVKKASLFSRIAGRLRSSSGVRVDKTPAGAKVERVKVRGATSSRLPVGDPVEPARSTRKLSEREEAKVVLDGHFQELMTLMRSTNGRMDDKLGQLVEQLPALGSQQLEVLRGVAGEVEQQHQASERIARSLQGLPDMMTKVQGALERAAQSDARTSATMREFQGTMDRIHSAMGRMVENSEQQTRATQNLASERQESLEKLATGIEHAQHEAVQELREASDASLESLRRTHEDQSNRLQRVVQDHAVWNKAMLVVLAVMGVGLFGLIVMQLVR